MKFQKWWAVCFGLLLSQLLSAQAPADYYAPTKGKAGKSLKTALHEVVKQHVERTYSQLWTDFRKTDVREDGKVWDMYSGVTNYDFGGSAQGANYKKEGDSYNREHSFPKSWFSEGKPMYTDLFHMYPTDGYVNNRRSNYPFGETNNPTYQSEGGWSKLGPSSVPGYSGTVFEPNDEYKGDFARTYFYMATCYEDQIANWNSKMLNHTSYPAYAPWALDMLLRWAKEDPVSPKEVKRNEEVYRIQQNRNPFIDYPGLEDWVWGSRSHLAFDPDHYDPNAQVDPQPGDSVLSAPVFSLPSGEVEKGTKVTIACDQTGAYVYYTLNGGELKVGYAPVTVEVNEDVVVEAYAMIGEKRSKTVRAEYRIKPDMPSGSNGVFVKVTDAAGLETGVRYLMVCESKPCALAAAVKDVRGFAAVTVTDNTVTADWTAADAPTPLTLGGDAQGYTWYDAASGTYLALTSNKNKLHSVTTVADEARWTVTFTEGNAAICSVPYPTRSIRYNPSAPRFATYTSGQQPVALYRETNTTGIVYPQMTAGRVDVFTLDGRRVRDDVRADEAVKGLPRGIYVVGGVKVLVK